MRRQSKYNVSPLHKDVKYGSGGRAAGQFVIGDGESKPVYNFLLLQENRIPIAQEDGKHIFLEDANA
jgi:hypothetical protein